MQWKKTIKTGLLNILHNSVKDNNLKHFRFGIVPFKKEKLDCFRFISKHKAWVLQVCIFCIEGRKSGALQDWNYSFDKKWSAPYLEFNTDKNRHWSTPGFKILYWKKIFWSTPDTGSEVNIFPCLNVIKTGKKDNYTNFHFFNNTLT